MSFKYLLTFSLSIISKYDCLSAGKREHITVKGKHLYYLYGKVSGQKKNPCFGVLSFRHLRKDFATVYFPEEYARMSPRKTSFGELQAHATIPNGLIYVEFYVIIYKIIEEL